MSIYHGDTIERDRYGYIEMQSVPVLFNEKPSFSELVARAREELHYHGADDDDGIAVEGVLHLVSSPNRVCRPVGELCEIGYEVSVLKFGRGCTSGVS